MRSSVRFRAFSLIEVIVAVALFAGAVAVILALLPGLTQRNLEAADRLAAQRLPGALEVELRRLAASDMDALAARIPRMSAPLDDGLAFVATRDGVRLHTLHLDDVAAVRLDGNEQYFLVECWRFPEGPLRFEPATGALALAVRVSWPYRQPGSPQPTAAEFRHEWTFAMGVNQ